MPALRHQDERVVALEAELRWNILPKWALVGSVGGAATDGDLVQYESQNLFGTGGIGERHLFAADLGLWIGVDIARGPEDTVWYIQVGHAWEAPFLKEVGSASVSAGRRSVPSNPERKPRRLTR